METLVDRSHGSGYRILGLDFCSPGEVIDFIFSEASAVQCLGLTLQLSLGYFHRLPNPNRRYSSPHHCRNLTHLFHQFIELIGK